MFNNLKNKTVLYVEDEIAVLQNISELLENFFIKVYTASDGEIGYNLFLENKIDIIFIDIELPKMNGIELIHKVRAKNRDIHIIVVSAYTKTDYFLDCIELKVDRYIIKPFTTRKITQLLEGLDRDFEVAKEESIIKLDNEYSFNTDTKELIFNQETISLTQKERILIKLFLSKPNKLISIMDMEYEIWPNQDSSASRRRSLVSRLRAKLKHRFIETCSSEGYIFRI
jgi:DNA-binding response OmpR family regulator